MNYAQHISAAQNNISVEPVKGDIKIPAKLKGAVKAEGKWFIISFNVHYEMSGDTEWSGSYEFGNDDNGIYFSSTVAFKGIDITLTKYEEVKVEVDAGQKKTDNRYDKFGFELEDEDTSISLKMEDGKINGDATLKAKEERRWSWLKPNDSTEKQQPKKYYFVKS